MESRCLRICNLVKRFQPQAPKVQRRNLGTVDAEGRAMPISDVWARHAVGDPWIFGVMGYTTTLLFVSQDPLVFDSCWFAWVFLDTPFLCSALQQPWWHWVIQYNKLPGFQFIVCFKLNSIPFPPTLTSLCLFSVPSFSIPYQGNGITVRSS